MKRYPHGNGRGSGYYCGRGWGWSDGSGRGWGFNPLHWGVGTDSGYYVGNGGNCYPYNQISIRSK